MNEKQSNSAPNKHYNSIDGLRAFAALGILVMHVAANGKYEIGGFTFGTIIPSFAFLVFLFMIVSGFSVCCGYYERFKSGNFDLNTFYKRRFSKIWPYFTVLVALELVISPSINALYEGFADLTLAFSLLPNPQIQVIGVARTLGIIFLFYMMFPYFCFLLYSKKRAWFAFVVSLIFNFVGTRYFFTEKFVGEGFSGRQNFIYCSSFFIAGGLIYLYRDTIARYVGKLRYLTLIPCFVFPALYYVFPQNTSSTGFAIQMLVIFSVWLIYAIATNGVILNNPVTRFLSGISMEIYLSHMVAFRLIEKLHLTHLFDNDILSYIASIFMTLAGTLVFVLAVKYGLSVLNQLIEKIRKSSISKV